MGLVLISAQSTTTSIRIIQSSDDAEEAITGPFTGDTEIDSSDLEMIEDLDFQEGNQEIGLRFQNVTIPKNALIHNAYIEFEVDEINTVTTNLNIFGEAIDNAPTYFFGRPNFNITQRTKTTAFILWNIPAWNIISQKQLTPNINNVITEIVERPGWTLGNAMAFIINGTGKRVAEAWDGEAANAPLLVINWSEDPYPNFCPSTPQNWDVDMSDNVIVNSACNLTGFNITFTGVGNFTINSTINIDKLNNLSNGMTIFIKSGAKLNLNTN